MFAWSALAPTNVRDVDRVNVANRSLFAYVTNPPIVIHRLDVDDGEGNSFVSGLPAFSYRALECMQRNSVRAFDRCMNVHLSVLRFNCGKDGNAFSQLATAILQKLAVKTIQKVSDLSAGLLATPVGVRRCERDCIVERHAAVRYPRLDGLFQISIQFCIAHCSPPCYCCSQRYLSAQPRKGPKSLSDPPKVRKVSKSGENRPTSANDLDFVATPRPPLAMMRRSKLFHQRSTVSRTPT